MKAVQRLLAVFSAAVLAACGGGSSGGGGAQLDGAIVKGPVTGSSVCAYALLGGVKGAKLNLQATAPGGVIADGCFVTGADGGYAFTVPGYTGEVLIEASGGTFCSDENPVSGGACTAGGAPVTLSETMTAAASVTNGTRSTTYVTPLTTAAVNNAAANGGVTVETFRGRFATLAGTVLGNSSVTPSTVPTPATHTYLASAAQQMRNGTKLSTIVSNLQGGSGGTIPTGTTPATLNAALVGSYDLVFKKGNGAGCGSLCPYTDGQTVHVEIHTDGRLVVGSLELTNPFVRSYGGTPNLHEAIWLDPKNNIEYALSDNATGGKFSEINVGNAANATNGISAFLGQIRKPEPAGTAVLQAAAGTYPKAYQYTGSARSWTGLTVDASGAITFTGGTGPSLAANQVGSVESYINCCNSILVKATIDINGDSTVNDEDSIRLFIKNGLVSAVEYFSGPSNVSTNQIGVAVGTVAALVHDGTAIPSTNSFRATFRGTAVDLAITNAPQRTANQLSFSVSDSNQLWQVLVTSGTGLQVNTPYQCAPGSVNITTTLFSGLYGVANGGRCTFTLTEYTAGGVVAGKFVAEFGDYAHEMSPILNGVFRYTPPN